MYTIWLPATAEQLRSVRHAVKRVAKTQGCSETLRQQHSLAVDEVFCNIICHAYGGANGSILFGTLRLGKQLILRLRDARQNRLT